MKSRYVTIQNETFSEAVYWLGKFFFLYFKEQNLNFFHANHYLRNDKEYR